MATSRLRGGTPCMASPAILRVPEVIDLQSRDRAQQCGLAAAGRADQGHEAALLDIEIDVFEGVKSAVVLFDVPQSRFGRSFEGSRSQAGNDAALQNDEDCDDRRHVHRGIGHDPVPVGGVRARGSPTARRWPADRLAWWMIDLE